MQIDVSELDFEWDEEKRIKNLEKHKLDFGDAPAIFEHDYIIEAAKTVENEERNLAIEKIEGRIITVIFQIRRNACRIISMRRARKNERAKYSQVFGQ
jgi:uncharacterized DUF497 family protein